MLHSSFNTMQTADSPPKQLMPWLIHTDSLTDKLKHQIGEAHLTVIKQQWYDYTWWTNHVLGLEQPFFQREIVISAQEKSCWYARTIIPLVTYQENKSFFSRLKQESLGQLIFDNRQVKRHFLDYYCIDTNSLEYYWLKPLALSRSEKLWSRLAVFTVKERFYFYLVEIFLPDLLKVIHEVE